MKQPEYITVQDLYAYAKQHKLLDARIRICDGMAVRAATKSSSTCRTSNLSTTTSWTPGPCRSMMLTSKSMPHVGILPRLVPNTYGAVKPAVTPRIRRSSRRRLPNKRLPMNCRGRFTGMVLTNASDDATNGGGKRLPAPRLGRVVGPPAVAAPRYVPAPVLRSRSPHG